MSADTWLPVWLRVAASVALAVALMIHVVHLIVAGPRGRAWHAGHVLMALGMIDMFSPTTGMIVPAWAGEVIFAVAALAVAWFVATELTRVHRLGWRWPLVGADLAAMVYMFAMPVPELGWLTGLLVGWFTLQTAGWATGWLDTVTDLGAAERVIPAAGRRGSAHSISVRATLAVMGLGMAYMFLAMQLGMSPLPGMRGTMP